MTEGRMPEERKNEHESNPESTDIVDENYDLSHEENELNELNAQLELLNSALDALEKKNDDIHAQFQELLLSNRATRQQMKQALEEMGQ
ncbi:bublin coiled-coil protein [Bacillus rossius redtenbacheri]|uniref:bublin coiled-coil protein n=1 Tax=Bacillus rossius redtenbacheri TaxID=93214 RepID=UPI002FDD68CA